MLDDYKERTEVCMLSSPREIRAFSEKKFQELVRWDWANSASDFYSYNPELLIMKKNRVMQAFVLIANEKHVEKQLTGSGRLSGIIERIRQWQKPEGLEEADPLTFGHKPVGWPRNSAFSEPPPLLSWLFP